MLAYLWENKEWDIAACEWGSCVPSFILDATDDNYKEIRREKARLLIEGLPKPAGEQYKVFHELGLLKLPEVEKLPSCSFTVQFVFKLAKPYISRDDEVLYPSNNPVRKDKVFKIPMIAPSAWKGHLRNAIRIGQGKEDGDPVLVRLLGGPGKEGTEELVQGRVFFYPTFFTNIRWEVINPHDRRTKAGTNPIYFECVPEGEKGRFALLYVPHMALNGVLPGTSDFKRQVKEDMEVLFNGISDMMLTYGFSARKTAGYGAADDQLSFEEGSPPGKVEIHLRPELQAEAEAAAENRGRSTPEICRSWMDSEGNFPVYDKNKRNKKVVAREWSKSWLKRYMEAKRAWDEYRMHFESDMVKAVPAERKVTVHAFKKLTELHELAGKIWPAGGDFK